MDKKARTAESSDDESTTTRRETGTMPEWKLYDSIPHTDFSQEDPNQDLDLEYAIVKVNKQGGPEGEFLFLRDPTDIYRDTGVTNFFLRHELKGILKRNEKVASTPAGSTARGRVVTNYRSPSHKKTPIKDQGVASTSKSGQERGKNTLKQWFAETGVSPEITPTAVTYSSIVSGEEVQIERIPLNEFASTSTQPAIMRNIFDGSPIVRAPQQSQTSQISPILPKDGPSNVSSGMSTTGTSKTPSRATIKSKKRPVSPNTALSNIMHKRPINTPRPPPPPIPTPPKLSYHTAPIVRPPMESEVSSAVTIPVEKTTPIRETRVVTAATFMPPMETLSSSAESDTAEKVPMKRQSSTEESESEEESDSSSQDDEIAPKKLRVECARKTVTIPLEVVDGCEPGSGHVGRDHRGMPSTGVTISQHMQEFHKAWEGREEITRTVKKEVEYDDLEEPVEASNLTVSREDIVKMEESFGISYSGVKVNVEMFDADVSMQAGALISPPLNLIGQSRNTSRTPPGSSKKAKTGRGSNEKQAIRPKSSPSGRKVSRKSAPSSDEKKNEEEEKKEKNKVHQCELCNKTYDDSERQKIRYHVLDDCPHKKYQCPLCNYGHFEIGKVRRHINATHKIEEDPVCFENELMDAAPDVYMRRCFPHLVTGKLQVGRRINYPNQHEGRITCQLCSEEPKITLAPHHIVDKHEKLQVYSCDRCPYQTPFKLSMSIHYQASHYSVLPHNMRTSRLSYKINTNHALKSVFPEFMEGGDEANSMHESLIDAMQPEFSKDALYPLMARDDGLTDPRFHEALGREQCETCKQVFEGSKYYDLFVHAKTHLNSDGHQWACPERWIQNDKKNCVFTATTKFDVEVHMWKVHGPKCCGDVINRTSQVEKKLLDNFKLCFPRLAQAL